MTPSCYYCQTSLTLECADQATQPADNVSDMGRELWFWVTPDPGVAIRCLDCGRIFCPDCARKHFGRTDMNDANGVELKPGDHVFVECEVVEVGRDDGDCNLKLITVRAMPPRREGEEPRRSQLMLSSRQAIVVPDNEPNP